MHVLWYTRDIKKTTIGEGKRCPACGQKENQKKIGYNRSGTQRCICKECGVSYAIDPKQREYSEGTKTLAMKMYYSGISGQGVGKVLKMNKANVYRWIKNEANVENFSEI